MVRFTERPRVADGFRHGVSSFLCGSIVRVSLNAGQGIVTRRAETRSCGAPGGFCRLEPGPAHLGGVAPVSTRQREVGEAAFPIGPEAL